MPPWPWRAGNTDALPACRARYQRTDTPSSRHLSSRRVGAIFVSGLGVSPTFITAFGLIERRIPPAVLTEGISWVMTGIGIGMALGAFVAGWAVDSHGASNGFWVSVMAGVAALLTVLFGQRALGAPRHRGAVVAGAQAGSGADVGPDNAVASSCYPAQS